jgi:ABC-type glycerol-3-phosphate transport system permease component
MVLSSVKTNAQIYTEFWKISFPFHFEQYKIAWDVISPYVFNSVYITIVSVVTSVFLASLTAYVIARFKFPGREFFYYYIIAIVMIPGILTLIPSFILIKNLGLRDTRWALFLPYISVGQVFAIFILRSFFEAIPNDLIEAARIDGASHLRIYFTIIIPLSKAIIGTVALMRVITIWNDYIWPLVTLSKKELWTVTVGLAFLRSEFRIDYGSTFAGYTIASLPLLILFAFTMKTFVRGLTSGALKA